MHFLVKILIIIVSAWWDYTVNKRIVKGLQKFKSCISRDYSAGVDLSGAYLSKLFYTPF